MPHGDSPTPAEFVAKWRGRNLTERQAAHAHFIELCRLLSIPAPLDNPADDANYLFDALTATAGSHVYAASLKADPKGSAKARRKPKGATAHAPPASAEPADLDPSSPGQLTLRAPASKIIAAPEGTHGFSDVWKRGHFCWEYKRQGRHANLAAALRQLKEYKDSLDNPPLLIVCDIDDFEIHTNFTGHPTKVYRFGLEDLAEVPKEWREQHGVAPLQVLRYAFTDPEWFRPKQTVNDITEELAARFGDIARQVTARKKDGKPAYDPHDVAHFLMQVIFALFAGNVGLLPKKRVLEIIRGGVHDPDRFTAMMRDLFAAMAVGGTFGTDQIDHFNGGLFNKIETQRIPRLNAGEIGLLSIVAERDWSAIEPSILGTLFERSLDPGKRSQIGAHYTSRDDIMLIVEPVIMEPLKREWEAVQRTVANLIATREALAPPAPAADANRKPPPARNGKHGQAGKARGVADSASTHASLTAEIEKALRTFAERLSAVRILDPACGSGNFLYVSIQQLLDLEKQVIAFGARAEVGVKLKPKVGPTQLHGIEINPYAAELARVSIWIGYLKWKRENGIIDPRRPILDSLDTIEERDAIVDRSNPGLPLPAPWPVADFIVGNPPFLGIRLMRAAGITDAEIEAMHAAYPELPGSIDLCCYWFEQARKAIERKPSARAGLLATQGIRGGDNRTVLQRIKQTGDIFMAWSDRIWTLDGAAVQVSMIGFDNGSRKSRTLDGHRVERINADLTTDVDATTACPLAENAGIAFMGDTKGGAFDLTWKEAATLLDKDNVNPGGEPNSSVLRPWINGLDITRKPRGMFIVDFGCDADEAEASRYQAPFAHVERHVYPERKKNRRETYAKRWWIHVEPRPALRAQMAPLRRFICTPTLTKFRLFSWLSAPTLPDHQLILVARADDYFFGVLHSAVHELWSRRQGTQLREAESGFRYTPTSCFETFPLPWPPGSEPTKPMKRGDRNPALHQEIDEAAKHLDTLREGWLNPPEWIASIDQALDLSYRTHLAAVPDEVRPLVRRSAIMAEAAKHHKLKGRTLTNLYNERPAWLRLAHKRLDRAVLAAYAAVDPEGGWDPAWADVYEPFGAGGIADQTGSARTVAKGKKPRGLFDSGATLDAKATARAAREPIDQRILANLLRLNLSRAPAAA